MLIKFLHLALFGGLQFINTAMGSNPAGYIVRQTASTGYSGQATDLSVVCPKGSTLFQLDCDIDVCTVEEANGSLLDCPNPERHILGMVLDAKVSLSSGLNKDKASRGTCSFLNEIETCSTKTIKAYCLLNELISGYSVEYGPRNIFAKASKYDGAGSLTIECPTGETLFKVKIPSQYADNENYDVSFDELVHDDDRFVDQTSLIMGSRKVTAYMQLADGVEEAEAWLKYWCFSPQALFAEGPILEPTDPSDALLTWDEAGMLEVLPANIADSFPQLIPTCTEAEEQAFSDRVNGIDPMMCDGVPSVECGDTVTDTTWVAVNQQANDSWYNAGANYVVRKTYTCGEDEVMLNGYCWADTENTIYPFVGNVYPVAESLYGEGIVTSNSGATSNGIDCLFTEVDQANLWLPSSGNAWGELKCAPKMCVDGWKNDRDDGCTKVIEKATISSDGYATAHAYCPEGLIPEKFKCTSSSDTVPFTSSLPTRYLKGYDDSSTFPNYIQSAGLKPLGLHCEGHGNQGEDVKAILLCRCPYCTD